MGFYYLLAKFITNMNNKILKKYSGQSRLKMVNLSLKYFRLILIKNLLFISNNSRFEYDNHLSNPFLFKGSSTT